MRFPKFSQIIKRPEFVWGMAGLFALLMVPAIGDQVVKLAAYGREKVAGLLPGGSAA